ncbi:SO2930 family diheme c-type cytochrome [Fibrella sp. WM1]|uniref:SO2930 family diheme c-type cytochrome n=1 Tax=Fibrella musci TaxID=3242485 RepID=UPI0035211ECB
MKYLLLMAALACLLLSLNNAEPTGQVIPQNLSEYGFFVGNLADQQPAEGVVPYRLNTPLFSDYAEKLRFVKLPAGLSARYDAREVMDFPVGTTIIKTFYFPVDFRDAAKGRRLMETRLLIRNESGWKALEYVWNDAQTDAVLEVAGDRKTVRYVDAAGRTHEQLYVMPNLNQCKSCHNRNEVLMPIGPTARQLNGPFDYGTGPENQLTHWQKTSLLTDPASAGQASSIDPATAPRAPVWNDPATGTLAERARIYLDINCAHCHRPDGPASTSGLNLTMHEQNPTAWGLHKTPVAAGRGSGGHQYDIVPSKPNESILLYRMESTDPGVMMPEVARKVAHREGIALIREWIEKMNE